MGSSLSNSVLQMKTEWIPAGKLGSGCFPCCVKRAQQQQALPHGRAQYGTWGVQWRLELPYTECIPIFFPSLKTEDAKQQQRNPKQMRLLAQFLDLYSHVSPIDDRVPFLTAALTPLCFFGVQICQGHCLRMNIKAFFPPHLLKSQSFYLSKEK